MDATLTHTAYTWIEQLLVPAALALASWQVLRRSARRPALRRALLVRPLQGLLAALGPSRPLGAWAERRLALLTALPVSAAAGAADCASGCGRCGGCSTAGPENGAAARAPGMTTEPVRWLGRAGVEPRR